MEWLFYKSNKPYEAMVYSVRLLFFNWLNI